MKKVLIDLYQDFLDAKEAFKDDPKKHIPNILTILRILSGPIVLITSITINLPVALIIATIGASTDLFDGILSRRWNAKSEFGRKLDTFADKELSLVLISLNIVNNIYFVITLILEAYIAKVNMKAVFENKKASTSQIGRVKTFALYLTLLLGIISQFVPILSSLTLVGLGATTILQLDAVANYIMKYKNQNINESQIENTISFEEINKVENEKTKTNTKKEELQYLRDLLIKIKDEKVEAKEEEKTLKKRYYELIK